MKKMITMLTALLGTASITSAMSLDAYLDLVKQKNESYQSKANQAEGSKLLTREADLVFSPTFFAEVNSGYDEKLPTPPTIIYDKAKSDTYSVGVSQQFGMGLQAKVSYLLTNAQLVGVNKALLGGTDQFSDSAAKLELSLPLWKNGFGRGARANEELTRQQALATSYAGSAQALSILNDSENAYWRLVSAVEQTKIAEQSVKAAQNILSYVQNKKKKNLGEQSDVLQANAVVEAYGLQLQQSQVELRSAQRAFNLYLNKPPMEQIPALDGFNFVSLENISIPESRPGDRLDVKASEAQALLAKASAVVATERNKPSLDVYSTYTTYGQGGDANAALTKTGKFDQDAGYVGLRFSIPLNVGAQSDAQKGAMQTSLAAEEGLRYLKYSQEQNWIDLVQKITDAKETLKLSGKIEQAHKSKLENERIRLREGRTTTYQVILFEQDYSQAQASRVRAAAQILSLQAQTKLYQAKLEGGK